MSAMSKNPDASGAGVLSIALIGPNEVHRKEVARSLSAFPGGTIREFSSFPPDLDLLPQMLEQHYDVVVIGLDSNPKYALEIVETIFANGSATIMVYSAQADLDLALKCMRAGAREFLTLPLDSAELAAALARIAIRQPGTSNAKKSARKLFVFLGAKGGCGVTTIAANFAVSVAQESGLSTLLIDLGLPLGDAALNLGMVTEYSTANAFQDFTRLDASFLSSLLARHSSGLSVLAAPGEFPRSQGSNEAIDKLLTVARQNFDYVVVDAGSRLDLRGTVLFEESANLYLITQIRVSELRNANRLITQFFSTRGSKLQVVLNRYIPHAMGFDEKRIAKALTRVADWKIPDDYATARRTQNTATPIALEDSPISRSIRQMARKGCSLPKNRDKGFSLLGALWPFGHSGPEAD
jgi:pilus assembly protein CpaE